MVPFEKEADMSNVKHKNCAMRQLAKAQKQGFAKTITKAKAVRRSAQLPNKRRYISNFANSKRTVNPS